MVDIPSAVAALRPRKLDTLFFRACNLPDPRPSVEALPLTPGQKLFLYRGAGFTRKPTDGDLIQQHVEQVFTRKLLGRQDRYSKARHALYVSEKVSTVEGEMRYYARAVFFNPVLDAEQIQFDLIGVNFAGLAAKMSSLYRRFPWLRSLKSPDETQTFGDSAADVLSCLLVRSVRARGDNGVLFRSGDIQGGTILPPLRLLIKKWGGGRITKRLTSGTASIAVE